MPLRLHSLLKSVGPKQCISLLPLFSSLVTQTLLTLFCLLAQRLALPVLLTDPILAVLVFDSVCVLHDTIPFANYSSTFTQQVRLTTLLL